MYHKKVFDYKNTLIERMGRFSDTHCNSNRFVDYNCNHVNSVRSVHCNSSHNILPSLLEYIDQHHLLDSFLGWQCYFDPLIDYILFCILFENPRSWYKTASLLAVRDFKTLACVQRLRLSRMFDFTCRTCCHLTTNQKYWLPTLTLIHRRTMCNQVDGNSELTFSFGNLLSYLGNNNFFCCDNGVSSCNQI